MATLAGCSIRSIYYIISYDRDYGTVSNPFARTVGRSRALNIGDLNFLVSVIAAKPKVFLDELQEELFAYRDVEVSIPTISKITGDEEIPAAAVSVPLF